MGEEIRRPRNLGGMFGCPNNCSCPKDLEVCPHCHVHVARWVKGIDHAKIGIKLKKLLKEGSE